MVAQRIFNSVAAFMGLLVLGPLFFLIASLVKLTSPGPVFHHAHRVGQHGKHFRLYKFRTMQVDAAQTGPGVTRAGDPRITRLGRWLRKLKLDELPQLINVLKGEMNLVGPRPEDPRYVALYTPEQRQVLSVPPGITSLASVQYRDEESILKGGNWEEIYCQVVLPHKLQIELAYLQQQSFLSDIKVILKTLLLLAAPATRRN